MVVMKVVGLVVGGRFEGGWWVWRWVVGMKVAGIVEHMEVTENRTRRRKDMCGKAELLRI